MADTRSRDPRSVRFMVARGANHNILSLELGGFLDTRPDNSSGCGNRHIVLLWRSRNDLVDGLCEAGDCIAHCGKHLRYVHLLRHVEYFFNFGCREFGFGGG
jgi:hypothetical protein